jgi:GNAT superfamily N-acetyltransferase
MYEGSGMGWNSTTKLDEFNEPEMTFLVIYKSESTSSINGENVQKESTAAASAASASAPAAPAMVSVTDKKLRKYLDQRGESALGTSGTVCAFASLLPSVPEFEPDSSDDKDEEEDEDDGSSLCSYLYELHVNPSHQSKGLAKHLLSQAKLLCLATHPQRPILKLTVFNMNVPAQNFYLYNDLKYINEIGKSNTSSEAIHLKGTRRKGERSKLHPKLSWTQSYSRIQNIKGWREMVWEGKDC